MDQSMTKYEKKILRLNDRLSDAAFALQCAGPHAYKTKDKLREKISAIKRLIQEAESESSPKATS